jgi:hypothetical protein
VISSKSIRNLAARCISMLSVRGITTTSCSIVPEQSGIESFASLTSPFNLKSSSSIHSGNASTW